MKRHGAEELLTDPFMTTIGYLDMPQKRVAHFNWSEYKRQDKNKQWFADDLTLSANIPEPNNE